ncbi:ACP S-malonyltransferase [Actinophytocola gossypii]|uniref:[acyl-carrier-protein] S-malonyltransferase n=1 Tax=Actinophytocola gossypii TaxID=2812003 RepID=A0ABT2JB75_9PSEU|nr:ACP S-malonyltransferase [Actinophytocola gossypii]MCT2585122.1 ACP S-malonyltransferase [Actinophytocola gossypii]
MNERTGTAVVFPGMGPTAFADVGRFMLTNAHARELTSVADDVLGYSLLDRFRAGGDYSEAAQVAFLVNCLALARWAEDEYGVTPDFCVGPSFGEKPLVGHVGALPVPDTIRLTARLARCLEEYFATEHQDVVTHSFVRTPEPVLRELLAELDARGEWYDISCYVDDDFYMVSLREGSLDRLTTRLRAAGGMSLYTMRPPMHSAAFGPLRDRIAAEVLDGLAFADPRVPVVADQDGSLVTTGAGVATMLLDSVVRPLRWPDVVASLVERGVGTVYVCGPDRLFGRVPATTRHVEVVAVNPRSAMRPRRHAQLG